MLTDVPSGTRARGGRYSLGATFKGTFKIANENPNQGGQQNQPGGKEGQQGGAQQKPGQQTQQPGQGGQQDQGGQKSGPAGQAEVGLAPLNEKSPGQRPGLFRGNTRRWAGWPSSIFLSGLGLVGLR